MAGVVSIESRSRISRLCSPSARRSGVAGVPESDCGVECQQQVVVVVSLAGERQRCCERHQGFLAPALLCERPASQPMKGRQEHAAALDRGGPFEGVLDEGECTFSVTVDDHRLGDPDIRQ